MKVQVTKDHGPWKKGSVVTLDEREALRAIRDKWAKPVPERERAIRSGRETR